MVLNTHARSFQDTISSVTHQYHLITVDGVDTRTLPSGRPYASPQATGFEPSALIPECNAPSPVKGGGDVNLSGAAQQKHTNIQYNSIPSSKSSDKRNTYMQCT